MIVRWQCELQYQATGLTGQYAVALQIEDFASPTDSTPLSSMPIQFIVQVFTPTSNRPCSSQPQLVGTTPPNGSSICISSLSSWSTAITARLPNAGNNCITDIVTASPLGMRKSELVQSSNPGEWLVVVIWVPLTHQSGPNIFCYSALDSTGYAANSARSMRCQCPWAVIVFQCSHANIIFKHDCNPLFNTFTLI